jgi:hypothetical protein
VAQSLTQTPLPLQLAPEACGSVVVHACPHTPQFALSVDSFTHEPLQSVVGKTHVDAHVPAPLQLVPMEHAWLHDPQFASSDASLTQTPPQSV